MSGTLFDIVKSARATRMHEATRDKSAGGYGVIGGAEQSHSSLPEIIDTVVFIDSIGIYCWRRLPVEVFRELRQKFGKRLYVESGLGRNQRRPWWRITIHQPDLATFKLLADVQQNRFAITRVDIAFDFICRDDRAAKFARNFLTRHLVQRRRRGQQRTHVEGSTAYASRNKRAPRNSALYLTTSKTGAGPCCHFELRFFRAQPCKRVGVGALSDLIRGVDARALLASQARLVRIDEKATRYAAEKAARRVKSLHQGRSVDDLSAKILSLMKRRVQDKAFNASRDPISKARAQEFYDAGPHWRHCLHPLCTWEAFAPLPRWHHW